MRIKEIKYKLYDLHREEEWLFDNICYLKDNLGKVVNEEVDNRELKQYSEKLESVLEEKIKMYQKYLYVKRYG